MESEHNFSGTTLKNSVNLTYHVFSSQKVFVLLLCVYFVAECVTKCTLFSTMVFLLWTILLNVYCMGRRFNFFFSCQGSVMPFFPLGLCELVLS